MGGAEGRCLSTTDREEALAETRRVLGSGGVLLLSDAGAGRDRDREGEDRDRR